ncbi:MAG: hypothetical protein FH753_17325 [Firmicutes bacterium]|nr:hypothetical protein [Bacillota bacterium]
MRKENIIKVIFIIMLICILFGIIKYFNDTKRLKEELGKHYALEISTLLNLYTNETKLYLEKNKTLDVEYLKLLANSFKMASDDIKSYHGLKKINGFHEYGFTISNKLNDLIILIKNNEPIKKQRKLKSEILKLLKKGQKTFTFLNNEIKNTTFQNDNEGLIWFKRFHSPKKELKDRINALLI